MKKTWKYKVRKIIVSGDVAYIPLTQGKTAIIDACDVHLVEGWNWCAIKAESGLWYAYSSGRKKARLHNIIMNSKGIDHIDGDGLNNKRSNLRKATPQQQARNRKVNSNTETGYKGVSLRKNGKYRARIVLDKKRKHIGDFSTPQEAARAYDDHAKKHYGEFARLNFTEASDVQV